MTTHAPIPAIRPAAPVSVPGPVRRRRAVRRFVNVWRARFDRHQHVYAALCVFLMGSLAVLWLEAAALLLPGLTGHSL